MTKSCIIIGGGIGGLFTGSFLAKNGIKVTVLEQNHIIGGGLQCFSRDKKLYETGMHVAGGFGPDGNLYKICRYLGIYDELDIHHIPSAEMDEIYYHATAERYVLASGKQDFVDRLASYFPHQKTELQRYVDELFSLTDEVPLFSLKAAPEHPVIHSHNFFISADELIAKYIQDPKLQDILAYLNPLYSGRRGSTPAYVHALINVLYIKGAWRFTGGSQQLADALKSVIEDNGGAVLTASTVNRVSVADKCVNYVSTVDGRIFTADYYVSSVHPVELIKFTTPGAFRKSIVERINSIPNGLSAFSLYIDLKPNQFQYINHTCYYMADYGLMWQQSKVDNDNWPAGFMYMTPPDKNQGQYASRLLVHCVMEFGAVKKWEDTTVGVRGADYQDWKQERANRIIEALDSMYPGFRGMVERVYSASPLTIRDYYKTKEGAIFGFEKNCNNLAFSQLSVHTKISNLFLTGQNIALHGMCGVPLTAIKTAEAILGKNILINKINSYDSVQ